MYIPFFCNASFPVTAKKYFQHKTTDRDKCKFNFRNFQDTQKGAPSTKGHNNFGNLKTIDAL